MARAILILTIYKKKVANVLVIGWSKWPENFSSWPEQVQTLFFKRYVPQKPAKDNFFCLMYNIHFLCVHGNFPIALKTHQNVLSHVHVHLNPEPGNMPLVHLSRVFHLF